jgi:putative FmdB family regulatory protein
MRMLFDFECKKCAHIFEELVKSDIHSSPCPACKGKGVRLIAAPRIDWLRMGLDPGFPSAYERWGDAKTKHHQTDKGTMHKGKAPNLLMY